MSSVARSLAPNFLFGSYTIEDLVQEAHAWILEGDRLSSWDPERATLWTFTKRILWNRFCNIKRDQWERRDRPCHTCALAEYCAKTDSCGLFDDKSECDLWRSWHERNERKKSLQRSQGDEVVAEFGMDPEFQNLENRDFFQWCLTFVSDRTGLQKYLEGTDIGDTRLSKIIEEIRFHTK